MSLYGGEGGSLKQVRPLWGVIYQVFYSCTNDVSCIICTITLNDPTDFHFLLISYLNKYVSGLYVSVYYGRFLVMHVGQGTCALTHQFQFVGKVHVAVLHVRLKRDSRTTYCVITLCV